MAQQKVKSKDKPIGKKPVEKKHLIDPRYKNTFWTIVTIVALTIFFIVNNTKSVQEQGSYPPNYTLPKGTIQKAIIDSRIGFVIPSNDSNEIKKEIM
jgi:hypothetical protein